MTMPSPRKLARSSMAMLRQMGMTRDESARLVVIICDEVTGIIYRRAPEMDITWLAEVSAEAMATRQQLAARSPGETARDAVTDWADRVTRWSREFDQGHGPHHTDVR